MVTIPHKIARQNPQYRDIMAAALWAYRDFKRQDASLFENDPKGPRYLTFCCSTYIPLMGFVEYDRHTGRMEVDVRHEEAPEWRRIVIFE